MDSRRPPRRLVDMELPAEGGDFELSRQLPMNRIMDQKYRGFSIKVVEGASGWVFHAHPAKADLPILPKVWYASFRTPDEAIDAARAEIDRVLSF